MRETTDELLADINTTLDQLMQTAEALKSAKLSQESEQEVELLESTQESLLARLMHRQSILEMNQRKKMLDSIKKEVIEKKIVEYARSLRKMRRKSTLSTKSTKQLPF